MPAGERRLVSDLINVPKIIAIRCRAILIQYLSRQRANRLQLFRRDIRLDDAEYLRRGRSHGNPLACVYRALLYDLRFAVLD